MPVIPGTVTVQVALFFPDFTVMTAFPKPTAVTTPLALTFATFLLLVAYVIFSVDVNGSHLGYIPAFFPLLSVRLLFTPVIFVVFTVPVCTVIGTRFTRPLARVIINVAFPFLLSAVNLNALLSKSTSDNFTYLLLSSVMDVIESPFTRLVTKELILTDFLICNVIDGAASCMVAFSLSRDLSSVALHPAHILACVPAVSAVASFVVFHSDHECPRIGISSCFTSTSLHTAQCFPSVNPVSVHVAAAA